MRRQRNHRRIPRGQHIIAVRFHLQALHAPARGRGQLRQVVRQKYSDGFFIRSHRIDIDQRARKFEDSHMHARAQEWRNQERRRPNGPSRNFTKCRFPIALHPARKNGPNDSGQVLTVPPNRRASFPAPRFRRSRPVPPCAPGFAGMTRRATHGPRSSTKISLRIT